MRIPSLLRDVLKREGHGSVAKMARVKSKELDEDIPEATLYSWMTDGSYRRRHYTPTSLQLISRITGEPLDHVVEMAVADARDAGNGSDAG